MAMGDPNGFAGRLELDAAALTAAKPRFHLLRPFFAPVFASVFASFVASTVEATEAGLLKPVLQRNRIQVETDR